MCRLAIIIIYFASTWISQSCESYLLAFLGFLFMPATLLGYMYVQLKQNGDFSGVNMVLMIVLIVIDLAVNSGGVRVRYSNE